MTTVVPFNPDAVRWLIPLPWEGREHFRALAERHGLGFEVMAFCSGPALNDAGTRHERRKQLKRELRGFAQPLAFHGAFMDLALHSGDREIAAVSQKRILSDLEVASDLGCERAIFHTGFNPHVPVPQYEEEFFHGHRDFWQEALAKHPALTVCLENTYEREPSTLVGLARAVAHPRLQLCFDAAHAQTYSAAAAERWIPQLAQWLVHMHWNDNHGDGDTHLPVGEGIVPWLRIWTATLQLKTAPMITLELASIEALERSIRQLRALEIWKLPIAA